MSGRVPKYSVIAPGMMFMRNTVGPTTKMNTASTRASAMLMFDSQRMPRATPETAEAIVPRVSTPMITMASAVPVGGSPPTISTPRAIWRAPMPREAAVPKRVAMIASASMTRLAGEEESPPQSPATIALISGTRPRRKEM